MKLEKRLQALEDALQDTRGVDLFCRTIEALRSEEPDELAAVKAELKSAPSVLVNIAKAMLAARP